MSPIDTLEYCLALEKAGMPIDQAKIQASALKHAISNSYGNFVLKEDLSHFATKQDLSELDHSLKSSILTLALNVKNEISQFNNEVSGKFTGIENRFDHKLSDIENKLDRKITESEIKLDHKISTSFSKLDSKLIELDTKRDGEIRVLTANLTTMKWGLGILIGTTSTIFAKAVLDMMSVTL